MSAAVEVGAVSTRKGAKLHVAGGCGWVRFQHLIDGTLVELTTANAWRVCGNCRKAIRTALDTARELNAARTECSYTVKTAKAATERHLVELVELFRTPAEIAREAELLARFAVPVAEVAPVTLADFVPAWTRPNAHIYARRDARLAKRAASLANAA